MGSASAAGSIFGWDAFGEAVFERLFHAASLTNSRARRIAHGPSLSCPPRDVAEFAAHSAELTQNLYSPARQRGDAVAVIHAAGDEHLLNDGRPNQPEIIEQPHAFFCGACD